MAKTLWPLFFTLVFSLTQHTEAQSQSGVFLLSPAAEGYTFRELESFGRRVWVGDVNNDGIVVGLAADDERTNAVMWTAQGIEKLSRLPDETGALAQAINDDGVVVGVSFGESNDGGPEANTPVVWGSNGEVMALATLDRKYGEAADINGNGEIAGTSRFPEQEFFDVEPVSWSVSGEIQHLGNLREDPLGGFGFHASRAINNLGDVVGISAAHAFKWSSEDGMIDLGVLPDNTVSNANDINDLGQVVGWNRRFEEPRGDTAFLWTEESGMQPLEEIANVESNAYGINNAGQIVGAIDSGDIRQAVLWDAGEMLVLDEVAMPSDPTIRLTSARAINDVGQIIGNFEHVAIPEPTYQGPILMGLLLCLSTRRSRQTKVGPYLWGRDSKPLVNS